HTRAPRCRRRGEAVMRLIESVSDWLDQRLQLATSIRATMAHPVPRETASWFYVFGSAALTVFVLQIVTGILLALVYVPSAGEAWSSLQILNHDVSLGWFIRAVHGWGSNFMIAIVLVHMILVLALGINEWPMPGRVVRRATYLEEYHRLTHGADGIPFVPAAVWKDIFFSGFILLSIVACAAILGPFGPGGTPD